MSSLLVNYVSNDFRVVRATRVHEKVRHLKSQIIDGVLLDELIYKLAQKGSELYDSVGTVLKGKELELPKCYTFYGIGGHERNAIRIKWWESVEGHTHTL